MGREIEKTFKIVIAGNGGIGKTTLLKRFCYNQYSEEQKLTIGIEIFIKHFQFDDKLANLQIWDLGGESHFRFLMYNFIRGAAGAILGFEVIRRKSFIDLENWIELLRKNNPDLPIVLIATKVELNYHPMVNPTMAKNLVKNYNLIDFYEVSSKNNLNVKKPFKSLIQKLEGCRIESIKFLNSKYQ